MFLRAKQLEPLDRLACAIADTFVADVKSLYESFAIHDAYLRIVAFESAMSSFYFDALKDPLYSLGEASHRRRSAQSALLYALKRLLTAIAPMLSFTAEEAWQEIPEAVAWRRTQRFRLGLWYPGACQSERTRIVGDAARFAFARRRLADSRL